MVVVYSIWLPYIFCMFWNFHDNYCYKFLFVNKLNGHSFVVLSVLGVSTDSRNSLS